MLDIIYISIYLSIHLSIYLSIYLPICVYIYIYIWVYVSEWVFLLELTCTGTCKKLAKNHPNQLLSAGMSTVVMLSLSFSAQHLRMGKTFSYLNRVVRLDWISWGIMHLSCLFIVFHDQDSLKFHIMVGNKPVHG